MLGGEPASARTLNLWIGLKRHFHPLLDREARVQGGCRPCRWQAGQHTDDRGKPNFSPHLPPRLNLDRSALARLAQLTIKAQRVSAAKRVPANGNVAGGGRSHR